MNKLIDRIVGLLVKHHVRVRYGVLGATAAIAAGNQQATPRQYGMATVAVLNSLYDGMCPRASWVVGPNGYPIGYGNWPNNNYDDNWNPQTPLYEDVQNFMAWLDSVDKHWQN